MIKPNPEGQKPKIDKSAYIDETASVIGNVTLGKNVFVGPGAVIRADEIGASIVIGDNCNIQDRVVVHGLEGSEVKVGDHVTAGETELAFYGSTLNVLEQEEQSISQHKKDS